MIVHQFKAYKSVVFSMFRVVQPPPQPILEHFHPSKKKSLFISSHVPSPQSLATTDLLCLYKSAYSGYFRNHTIHNLLWLAPFTWYNVFKVCAVA